MAGLGLRGLAALNLVLTGVWIAAALSLRQGYVEAIRETIRQHRLDLERSARGTGEKSIGRVLVEKLAAPDPRT